MKKLIFLIAFMLPFLLNATDTDRTKRRLNPDRWSDEDKTNVNIVEGADSIVWIWEVNKYDPYKVKIIIDADSIAGMDTTLVWHLLGRNDDDLDWTDVTNGTVTAFNDTVVQLAYPGTDIYSITQAASTIAAFSVESDTTSAGTIDSLHYPAQAITNGALTLTSGSLDYDIIGLRLSLPDDDATGSGYTVDRIKLLIVKRGL